MNLPSIQQMVDCNCENEQEKYNWWYNWHFYQILLSVGKVIAEIDLLFWTRSGVSNQ